jgi:translocator protein
LAFPIVVASTLVVLVLAVGGWTTTVGTWYRDLRKPSWNPPNWVFGPAWTALLALAAWSGVSAWTEAVGDGSGRVVILALFGVNIVLHMLWSLAVGRYSSLPVWLLLPYLLWVTFAAFLNLTIVRLNQSFGERV